jgi:hypothetical protein
VDRKGARKESKNEVTILARKEGSKRMQEQRTVEIVG